MSHELTTLLVAVDSAGPPQPHTSLSLSSKTLPNPPNRQILTINLDDGRYELKEIQRLEGHTDRVWGLAWNPTTGSDGVPAVLASCSGDKTVRIWQQSSLTGSFDCKRKAKEMGKKGSNKKPPKFPSRSMPPMILREQSIGKRKKTSVNHKSMLKVDHLHNLAVWASAEASVPSLAAFFGHRLAAVREALGAPPDPSLVTCQRCESILQPGYNCTVRIEKNRAKARRRHNRPNISTQNNVVYTCHFCSHRNLKRGTPQGHTKEICPPKAKPPMKSKYSLSIIPKSVNLEKPAMSNPEVKRIDEIASPAMTTEDLVTESLATPSVSTCITLLEAKRRKRNRSGSKKVAESESNSAALDAENSFSTSNKRKKKPWMSLKEIAEHSEHGNNQSLKHLAIPFLL